MDDYYSIGIKMTAFLAFLFAFTIAVLVHEAGHFLAARRLGAKVYEFSIGFPVSPKILTFFRHRETAFTLRLLPLGGFVSFTKDNGEGVEDFLNQLRWKRAIITIAGPLFNFAFSFFILAFCLIAIKGLSAPQAAIATFSTVINSISAISGLLSSIINNGSGLDNLSGPVGIAVMAGQALDAGVFSLFYFTGMLSLSLAIFNLLPLPALDGGQLIVLAIESIKKQTLSEKAYGYIGAAGIAFILVTTVAVTYKDLVKYVF